MSSWVWYALVLVIISFSIGFGLGAVWAGHMGAFRQDDPDKPVRGGSDDADDYWSGNWDRDIR